MILLLLLHNRNRFYEICTLLCVRSIGILNAIIFKFICITITISNIIIISIVQPISDCEVSSKRWIAEIEYYFASYCTDLIACKARRNTTIYSSFINLTIFEISGMRKITEMHSLHAVRWSEISNEKRTKNQESFYRDENKNENANCEKMNVPSLVARM